MANTSPTAAWLDGPMMNLKIMDNVIVDQIADGINFHTDVTNSVASNNFIRNTGDDALAMWSERTADGGDTFDHNTIQTPVLANGIALYGDTDDTVSNNRIADPIRKGSGIQLGSRFGSEAFTGQAWITDNPTVRAGTFAHWNIGLGAIWIYALEKDISADMRWSATTSSTTRTTRSCWCRTSPVKDIYSITNVHFQNVTFDGTGTSVLSARVKGSATFENVDARKSAQSASTTAGRSTSRPPVRSSRRSTSAVTTAVGPPAHG